MIQTLGDVFLLVGIVSVGLVSFLLAVFLYNLIFIVMDLRQVMKRVNDLTAELEQVVLKPVELTGKIIDWVQKIVWDSYFVDVVPKKGNVKNGKKRKKKPKRKKGDTVEV